MTSVTTQFKKGQRFPLEQVAKRSGENHYKWRPEGGAGRSIHRWVQKQLGKPTTCEHCGKVETRDGYMHWSNKDHKYRRVLSDWQRLCASCHVKYDYATGLKPLPYSLKKKLA